MSSLCPDPLVPFFLKRYPFIAEEWSGGACQVNTDALLIDVSWLVQHVCTHPSRPGSLNQTAMAHVWIKLFQEIDNLILTIAPRRTILLAFNGFALPCVALPGARRRCFVRSAQRELALQAIAEHGCDDSFPDFDANCLDAPLPGDAFFANLLKELRQFIAQRVEARAEWRAAEVIISGYEVRGTASAKIAQWARGHPNLCHAVAGSEILLPLKKTSGEIFG